MLEKFSLTSPCSKQLEIAHALIILFGSAWVVCEPLVPMQIGDENVIVLKCASIWFCIISMR